MIHTMGYRIRAINASGQQKKNSTHQSKNPIMVVKDTHTDG
jgi:hypothetical protein